MGSLTTVAAVPLSVSSMPGFLERTRARGGVPEESEQKDGAPVVTAVVSNPVKAEDAQMFCQDGPCNGRMAWRPLKAEKKFARPR
ncbi:hypothetical protein MRX96_008475 [Rhipicephalus microplus]